jgi:hypothetical protein
MNSGCSGSTRSVSKRAGWAASSSSHRTSRPSVQGRSSRLRRDHTTTDRIVGDIDTASSAVSFIGTSLSRRVVPSAVTRATASASWRRVATASAP